MDLRPVTAGELEPDPERLEHQQDVGEQDGSVDTQPVDRLEGDLARGLRRFAQVEERVSRAQGAVLGHVAPGLAHEPHRRERGGLAAAGPEERRIRLLRHDEASVPAGTGGVKERAV